MLEQNALPSNEVCRYLVEQIFQSGSYKTSQKKLMQKNRCFDPAIPDILAEANLATLERMHFNLASGRIMKARGLSTIDEVTPSCVTSVIAYAIAVFRSEFLEALRKRSKARKDSNLGYAAEWVTCQSSTSDDGFSASPDVICEAIIQALSTMESVVYMAAFEGVPLETIAMQNGWTPKNVNAALRRAIPKVKKVLDRFSA